MSGEFAWALQNGDLEQVQNHLKKQKATDELPNGRLPMCIAADYGQKEVLEELIKNGADINKADKFGMTPLLSAIYEGHTACVKLLLDKGATSVGKAPSGETYIEAADKDEIKNMLKQK